MDFKGPGFNSQPPQSFPLSVGGPNFMDRAKAEIDVGTAFDYSIDFQCRVAKFVL